MPDEPSACSSKDKIRFGNYFFSIVAVDTKLYNKEFLKFSDTWNNYPLKSSIKIKSIQLTFRFNKKNNFLFKIDSNIF